MHPAQVQPPPPVPAATPAAAAAAKDRKQRERSRMEANVESEVDRLIDSQDNEYVLSRPKCAPRLGHPRRQGASCTLLYGARGALGSGQPRQPRIHFRFSNNP